MTEMMTNNYRVQQVSETHQRHKVTPAAVRRYFNTLETDSIPFVPMQVEVQIMTLAPSYRVRRSTTSGPPARICR